MMYSSTLQVLTDFTDNRTMLRDIIKDLPIGEMAELAGTAPIGGAAVVDGVALLKHAVPLSDLSIQEEFEHPLALVVAHADDFERKLTRADEF